MKGRAATKMPGHQSFLAGVPVQSLKLRQRKLTRLTLHAPHAPHAPHGFISVLHCSPRHMASAVVLDAAPVLMAAAPVLLGVGPALHPVGEAGVAVVDAPVSMPHAVLNVHVQVIAAMPRPRAAATCVATAPGLLVVRPAKVPVRKPGTAVVLEVVHMWLHVVGLVDHVRVGGCWDGHRDDAGVGLHVHWHVMVNHLGRDIVEGACPTKLVAAIFLAHLAPEIGPVMVPSVAVECRCGCRELILPN